MDNVSYTSDAVQNVTKTASERFEWMLGGWFAEKGVRFMTEQGLRQHNKALDDHQGTAAYS